MSLLKILLIIFSLIVIIVGGYTTTLVSNPKRSQDQRNKDVGDYGIVILLLGLLPLFFLLCFLGASFVYPQLLSGIKRYVKEISAFAIVCLLFIIIGSIIISFKDNKKMSSNDKNSAYIQISTVLTSVGVGLLVGLLR